MKDRSIAAHEAAHVVAAYILGMPIAKIEVWDDHGLTKLARKGRILGGGPDASFDHAIQLLAGGAYLRSLGLQTRDDGDFAKAAVLVRESVDSKAASRQAFDVVLEATQALVESERFQVLVAALSQELERQHWNYGPEVERFLRSVDPQRPREPLKASRWSGNREAHSLHSAPVSTIDHGDGSVSLYTNGRLLLSRGTRAEADRLAAEISDEVWGRLSVRKVFG